MKIGLNRYDREFYQSKGWLNKDSEDYLSKEKIKAKEEFIALEKGLLGKKDYGPQKRYAKRNSGKVVQMQVRFYKGQDDDLIVLFQHMKSRNRYMKNLFRSSLNSSVSSKRKNKKR